MKTVLRITIAVHSGWESIHNVSADVTMVDCDESSTVPYLIDATSIEMRLQELADVMFDHTLGDPRLVNAHDFGLNAYKALIHKAVREKVEYASSKTIEQLNEKSRELNTAQAENAKLKCMLEGARGVADDVYAATQGRPGNPLNLTTEPL